VFFRSRRSVANASPDGAILAFPMPRKPRKRSPGARNAEPTRAQPVMPVAVKVVVPPTAQNGGLLTGVVLVSLTLLVASLTITAVTTNDVWIHIKTGDLILQNLTIPRTDPYSFTASDHEYLVHEWLSAVILALSYAAAGVPGLIAFKFSVTLLSWLFLFLAVRARGDRLAVALPPFGVLGYVAAQRYLERPHIFTFLFCAAYLFLFYQYRCRGRRRAWLWAIVPLHVIWVNLHSGFFLGLMLLAAFGLGSLLDHLRGGEGDSRGTEPLSGADVGFLLCLPVICLAVSLINPHGVRLLLFPFQLTGMEVFMQNVFEWKPPFDRVFVYTYMFYGYAIWVVVLVGSFLARYWGTFRSGIDRFVDGGSLLVWAVLAYAFWWRQAWLTQHPWVWVALAVGYCMAKLKRVDFVDLGVVVIALVLSCRHNRGVGDALTITLPVLTHNLSTAFDRLSLTRLGQMPIWSRLKLNTAAVFLLSLALLLEALHIQVYGYWYSPFEKRESGIKIAGNMPVCAVDYVVRSGIRGNAFTSYTTAALLIQRLYPQVKVNMDSRNEVYGPALFEEYGRARKSPAAMAEYLGKYQVDFFLVRNKDLAPKVALSLLRDGWVQVFFDDENLVLVPRDRTDPELVERDAYRVALPALLPTAAVRPGEAAAFLQEADRALRDCPNAWLPRWYRTQALVHLGRPEEALEATLDLVQRKPDAWYAWQFLGALYEWAGKKDAAIEAYRKVLNLNSRYGEAAAALRRLGGLK
jgi:tetratricopeptide (TPR) repeat protein